MKKSETKQKTVLVAEDESDICEALVSALEAIGGYRVIVATNGEEALEKSLAEKPDHIVLDIHLPKMNGDEVLKQLRQDSWGEHVPVTILTAQSDITAISNAIEVGGIGTSYFVKSDISLVKLVEHIAMQIHA